MASALNRPWVAFALAAAAVAFVAWQLVPRKARLDSSASPVAAAEVPPPPSASGPDPSVGVALRSLAVDDSVAIDSMTDWSDRWTRDPYRPRGGIVMPTRGHRSSPKPSVEPRSASAGIARISGLATGPRPALIAGGRIVAEGDAFAGGTIQRIASDRVTIARPGGDTVLLLPRGRMP